MRITESNHFLNIAPNTCSHLLSSGLIASVSLPILYHARLETWNFDRAKTAGIDDRKLVHISNIDQFAIVDSGEFSRGSKSKFQPARGIARTAAAMDWNPSRFTECFTEEVCSSTCYGDLRCRLEEVCRTCHIEEACQTDYWGDRVCHLEKVCY